MSLQNLFTSPLPSPGPHAREDTLKSICDALESRLEAEINAQSSLKQRISDADEENKVGLSISPLQLAHHSVPGLSFNLNVFKPFHFNKVNQNCLSLSDDFGRGGY